jgi:hypothetical protein
MDSGEAAVRQGRCQASDDRRIQELEQRIAAAPKALVHTRSKLPQGVEHDRIDHAQA